MVRNEKRARMEAAREQAFIDELAEVDALERKNRAKKAGGNGNGSEA
jgi:hypothetical protein